MVWLGDQAAKPTDKKREQLLIERERLVAEIQRLKDAPLPSSSMAARQGRVADLTALAKKVTSIDRKLGRQVDDA